MILTPSGAAISQEQQISAQREQMFLGTYMSVVASISATMNEEPQVIADRSFEIARAAMAKIGIAIRAPGEPMP